MKKLRNPFYGRIGRLHYTLSLLLLLLIIIILLIVFIILGGHIPSAREVIAGEISEDVYLIFIAFLRLPLFPFMMRRFHDIGWKNSWLWSLIALYSSLLTSVVDVQIQVMAIVLVGIFLNFCLFFWPSAKGKNKFGQISKTKFIDAFLNKI